MLHALHYECGWLALVRIRKPTPVFTLFLSLRMLFLSCKSRVIYSEGYSLKIWNKKINQIEQIFVVGEEAIFDVLKMDSTYVIYSQEERSNVFSLKSRTIKKSFVHADGIPNSTLFLDTNRIMQGFPDGTIKIWNSQTGAIDQILVDHKQAVFDIDSFDSHRIVSASSDRTLKVWNLKTGKVEQTITGHTDAVNIVAVLDYRRIISASHDCTIKVWDIDSGQDIFSIVLDNTPTCMVVVRRDDHVLIVVGDYSGALHCLELVEPVAG